MIESLTMTKLPTPPIDEEAIIQAIMGGIGRIAEKLTAESARKVLRDFVRERLLRQEAIPRMQVIEAAEGGNEDADQALREFAIEYLSRGEPMPTEIANYVQHCRSHSPAARRGESPCGATR